jgi:hypothetical protein
VSKQQATQELESIGAVKETSDDRFGDTKTGWWLDGVFLGRDSMTALQAVRG